MKRNSVIVENLIENVMTEIIKPSKEYEKLLEKAIKLENEFLKLVGDNTEKVVPFGTTFFIDFYLLLIF